MQTCQKQPHLLGERAALDTCILWAGGQKPHTDHRGVRHYSAPEFITQCPAFIIELSANYIRDYPLADALVMLRTSMDELVRWMQRPPSPRSSGKMLWVCCIKAANRLAASENTNRKATRVIVFLIEQCCDDAAGRTGRTYRRRRRQRRRDRRRTDERRTRERTTAKRTTDDDKTEIQKMQKKHRASHDVIELVCKLAS